MQAIAYPDTQLFIDGRWCDGAHSTRVVDPATGSDIGRLALADETQLARAVDASVAGFQTWRAMSAFERSKILRAAATLLRERAPQIAAIMTMEQGKPLAESTIEVLGGADTIDWFAEEARRTYGRVVPSRSATVRNVVLREPVGPVAAFTPWNFPVNQAVRKVSAALAAGCSIVLKGPEETPASCAALIAAYADAGVPGGVVNLVYGEPAAVSSFLIAHPAIRKISFTGSTPVGKRLAALAGEHMKRVTMELGGHAPAMVFADADIGQAATLLAGAKFRNGGQVCVSPTRFLIEETAVDAFTEAFLKAVHAIKVGHGLEPGVTMGPLANARRVEAMSDLVDDAVARGARIVAGGNRIGERGNFFAPTVLLDVPCDARLMNEEPFGPIVPITTFSTYENAIAEANRLPYGLAAYGYSRSARTVAAMGRDIRSGMISINQQGLGMPETPFGGVCDSGYGSEGGTEAMEGYLVTKFIAEGT